MSAQGKRIFISYSHDSDEHRRLVRRIADSLTKIPSLDVHIDQYLSEEPDVKWPLWMETELELANKVLMVCTETYNRRVHKEEVPGVGRGVCWEANLIYVELYESQTKSNKFIPILLRESDRKHIPKPLGANNYYLFRNAADFEVLLRYLLGRSQAPAPVKGSVPELEIPEPLPPFTIVGTPIETQDRLSSGESVQGESDADSKPLPDNRKLVPNDSPEQRFEPRELDWYHEADARYFHGRGDDIKRLRSLLLDDQPVVRLFGPSGVGKSSLLWAGLLPELRRHSFRAAVVRPFDKPWERIPQQISEQILTAESPPLSPQLDLEQMRQELSAALKADRTPYLFLLIDQFEDIVSPLVPPEASERMVAFLQQVWEADQQSRPIVRVLISSRTDADSKLGPLWQEISGLPSGLPYHTIGGLTGETAIAVIEEVSKEAECKLPQPAEKLVEQLKIESQVLDASGEIFPPYLQMILARLIATDDTGKHVLGVTYLIGAYMQSRLEELEGHGGDYAKCRDVLVALSRSSGQKLSLTLGELAAEVRLSADSLLVVLRDMMKARLIRATSGDSYEIQHDRLAEVVIESLSDAEREFKAARELLAVNAASHPRTGRWLDERECQLIYRYHSQLQPNHSEHLLILGSILTLDGFGWLLLPPEDSARLELLAELTRDGDEFVSSEALDRICASGETQAVAILKGFLQDQQYPLRDDAITALGNLTPEVALPELLSLVDPGDDELEYELIEALEKIMTACDVATLESLARNENSDVRAEAIRASWRLGKEKALPLLQEWIRVENEEPMYAAIDALGRLAATETIPVLTSLLSHPQREVRMSAVHAMGTSERAEAIPVLTDVINDPASEPGIEFQAVSALGRSGQAGAVPVLLSLAREQNRELSSSAVLSLIDLTSKLEFVDLKNLIDDKNIHQDIRSAAVEALGASSASEAVSLLIELAQSSDELIRNTAIESLEQINADFDDSALAELIHSQNESLRYRGLDKLEATRNENAVPLLRDVICDKNDPLRLEAIELLGKTGQADAVPILADLGCGEADDLQWDETAVCARMALRELIPVVTATAVMQEFHRRDDAAFRGIVIESMDSQEASDRFELLREMASDENRDLSSAAVLALGRSGRADALPILLELERQEDRFAIDAVSDALSFLLPNCDFEFVRDQIKKEDASVNVRWAAIKSLGKLKHPEATILLMDLAREAKDDEQYDVIDVLIEKLPDLDVSELKDLIEVKLVEDSDDLRYEVLNELRDRVSKEELKTLFLEQLDHLSTDLIREFDEYLFAPAWWRMEEDFEHVDDELGS